jgi:outer membrane immunogenic protein
MSASQNKKYVLTVSTGAAIAPMLGLALAPMANAADMAVKAPLMKAPPRMMPSWTGCYIGVSAGGASQHSKADFSGVNGGFDPEDVGDNTGGSFIGGGLAGCNYQSGMFVFGLEGDFSGLSKPSGTYFTDPEEPASSYGSHVSWMATVRGRLGVTFGDGMNLLYATGGVAFTKVQASIFEGTLITANEHNDYSASKTGWIAGVGYERMLTPNVIIGVEGLFADFGSYTAASNQGKCCGTIHNTVAIGRARLSFKF